MERTQVKTKLWLVNNKDEPIMGEGRVSLLEAIKEEGSLNKACKKVNISYKHAWLLLREIEESVESKEVSGKPGDNTACSDITYLNPAP